MSVNMAPVAKTIPQSVAASIGRTITRYSYLEWILSKMLYDVLGLSVKQGRIAIRLPAPTLYVKALQDLLTFHGVGIQTKLKPFSKELDNVTVREMS
jgi:hypothetical protein